MVYKPFSTSDITDTLTNPRKECIDNECSAQSRAAGKNKIFGLHCVCPAKRQASSHLSFATDNFTNFMLELYSEVVMI